jgi:hypothetical protein
MYIPIATAKAIREIINEANIMINFYNGSVVQTLQPTLSRWCFDINHHPQRDSQSH